MAAQTAVAADGLQGIWGAGQAASVSDLYAMGARPLDSVQAGQEDLRTHPIQNAIRTAATSLSAAISLAQDLGQASPSMTHHSLAQSLRVTSEIFVMYLMSSWKRLATSHLPQPLQQLQRPGSTWSVTTEAHA